MEEGDTNSRGIRFVRILKCPMAPSAAKSIFVPWFLGIVPMYITIVHFERQYKKEDHTESLHLHLKVSLTKLAESCHVCISICVGSSLMLKKDG